MEAKEYKIQLPSCIRTILGWEFLRNWRESLAERNRCGNKKEGGEENAIRWWSPFTDEDDVKAEREWAEERQWVEEDRAAISLYFYYVSEFDNRRQ